MAWESEWTLDVDYTFLFKKIFVHLSMIDELPKAGDVVNKSHPLSHCFAIAVNCVKLFGSVRI